jgi:hypothetical protein
MTKKEKLEYFKLVEPKLREKYHDSSLKDSDFEALNIKGKDIELFKEIYDDFWFGDAVEKAFGRDSGLWDDKSYFGFETDLEFPDDKYFYQLGISNLRIERLKEKLISKTRILYINKVTGEVETPQSVKSSVFPDDAIIKNHVKLVVDEPKVFLDQLKKGEIDKILAYDKKNPTQWEVPKTHPISEVLEILEVDDLIDILAEDKNWILYQDTLYLSNGMEFERKNFMAYEDFQHLKVNEMTMLTNDDEECNKKTSKNRFFFKVDNPSKMRDELVKGNMKILDDIKNITFSAIFLTNNNEA